MKLSDIITEKVNVTQAKNAREAEYLQKAADFLINHLGLPVAHYIGGDTIPNSTFSQHALSNAKSDAVTDLRNDRIIHFDLFFILYLLFMLQTASFFI